MVQHTHKKYLVLGLGQSGAAAARWCAHQGWAMRLADTRSSPPEIESLQADLAQADVQWVLGPDALAPSVLENIDVLVLSPGLSPQDDEVAALLSAAQARGIACLNDLGLFAQALAEAATTRDYRPQLLAITGTNGKTTVARMLTHMLQAHGVAAQAAGNISPSFLGAWLTATKTGQWPEVWVLECSSFQLQTMSDLQPTVGALLNISQDHLDWHGSATDYAAAKQRLLAVSERVVSNADDPAVQALQAQLPQSADSRWYFSQGQPEQDRSLGLCTDAAQTVWFCVHATTLKHLLPVAALQVLGAHNQSNALAALAVLAAADWPIAQMASALADFVGEAHRCEWVRTVRAVRFINDSKGTNVGATVAAIQGLPQNKILIAGGLGKGQDFAPLAQAVADHQVRHSFLYGADASLIAQALDAAKQPYTVVDALAQAVPQAFAQAQANEVVLFSPACASLDQFANYMQRGQAFVQAVEELALDLGEVL